MYTALWIIWLAYLLIVEGAALLNKNPGDTLSEHLWSWFSIKDKKRSWRLRRVFLLSLLVWFIVHILTGGTF
jgi:hypothetical protein